MKDLSKVKIENLSLEDLIRLFTRAQERLARVGVGMHFTMQSFPCEPTKKKGTGRVVAKIEK